MNPSRLLRAVYRVLLWAYPSEFRAAYAAEMWDIAREREEEGPGSGSSRPLLFWARECLALMRSIVKERVGRRGGGPTGHRHHSNKSTLWEVWGQMWREIRLAIRTLTRRPTFAVVSVLTLALGIGANTAIFSVVNAVLLKPLPYQDPGRLVAIWENNVPDAIPHYPVAPANFKDFREQNSVFSGIAGYTFDWDLVHESSEGSFLVQGLGVSDNFFEVLGVQAALGRTLLTSDEGAEQDQSGPADGGPNITFVQDDVRGGGERNDQRPCADDPRPDGFQGPLVHCGARPPTVRGRVILPLAVDRDPFPRNAARRARARRGELAIVGRRVTSETQSRSGRTRSRRATYRCSGTWLPGRSASRWTART